MKKSIYVVLKRIESFFFYCIFNGVNIKLALFAYITTCKNSIDKLSLFLYNIYAVFKMQ